MNDDLTITRSLRYGAAKLDSVSESPRLDAELLLARALDVPRSYVIAHPEDMLDTAAADRFSAAVQQRRSGMPLAYISGEKEFWSMRLIVSPATLVPRPETEILVEQALQRIPRRAALRVLDLGTGSGAIAAALASERPLCEIVATDRSEAALAVARENARLHQLPNIELVHGDWLDPVAGRTFDLVVSNPPYVPERSPDLERLKHEPRIALAAGEDGLDPIRVIVRDARAVVVPGGFLLLEHGAEMEDAVAALLGDSGWSEISCVNDLAELPRVSIATK